MGGRLLAGPLLHDVGDGAAPPHLAPLVVHRPAPRLQPAVLFVLDAEVAQPQDVPLFPVQAVRRRGRRPLQGPPLGHHPGLVHGEGPVEDAEVGDAPAREVARLELAAVEGVAPPQVERPAGGDAALGLGEEFAALLFDALAVLVHVQAAPLARPVVGEHHVGPLAGRHPLRVDRADAGRGGRAARVPFAGQPEAQLPRAEGHGPAAPALLLVVLAGHDEVALVFRLINPHRDGERRVAVQIQRRQLDPRPGVEADRGMPVGAVLDHRAGRDDDRVPLARVDGGGAGGVVERQRQQLGRRLERRLDLAVPAAGQPLDEVGVDRRHALGERDVERRRLAAQPMPELAVGVVGDHQDRGRVRDVAVHDVLGGVAEERRQRVELALGDRIELVVVAGGAADGQPEEHVADGLGPVLGVDRLVLFRHHPALVGGDVVALKAGGDQLVEARFGQQVAGHLFDHEVVEPLVLVERPDHPVAPSEHLAVVVDVNAVGVAVARRVEPIAGAVLAPVRRLQQPVDEGLPGGLRVVGEIGREEAGVGRQPRQVEGRAAGQRRLAGLGRGGQPFGLQPREHEPVERVAHPCLVGHVGGRRRRDGLERPVLPPRGALLDPAGQHVDLPGRQGLAGRRRRRHPQAFVGVGDALVQQAGPGVAGHDGGAPRARPERPLPRVEPQPRLTGALVGPVARKAVVGQDGAHVALEVDGGRRRTLRGQAGGEGRQRRRAGRRQDSAPQNGADSRRDALNPGRAGRAPSGTAEVPRQRNSQRDRKVAPRRLAGQGENRTANGHGVSTPRGATAGRA